MASGSWRTRWRTRSRDPRDEMSDMKPKALVKARRDKFLNMGDKGLAA